jgi:radical SAM protein with 4Fe4S-binding SPASM domain
MEIFAATTQSITGPNDCYNNSIDYMNVNVELFLEAQQFHTYYYKKVCIDQNGLIKNCTSHGNDFGRFSPDTLLAVVTSSRFQKLWFAKKDDTEICRNCEFKYMCVDSREIFQKDNTSWFHKSPCNYDPKKSLWKDE